MNGKHSVLIIDDDPAKTQVMKDFITDRGFEADHSPSGKTGIEACLAKRFDIILLDLNLTDMSGIEVCRMIRSEGKNQGTGIVMVTSQSLDAAARTEGFRVGVDDYLSAPVNLGEMHERILAVLRRTKKNTVEPPAFEAELETSGMPSLTEPLEAPPPPPGGEGFQAAESNEEEPPVASDPRKTLRSLAEKAALRGRKILIDPRAAFSEIGGEDFWIASLFVAAVVFFEGFSRPVSGGAGERLALVVLSLATVGLGWASIGGMAFLILPFSGTDVTWRKSLTVAGLAFAPRVLGAFLSFTYSKWMGSSYYLDAAPLSSGLGMLSTSFPKALGALGLFDLWWIVLTVMAFSIGVPSEKGGGKKLVVALGAVGLVFGVFTHY